MLVALLALALAAGGEGRGALADAAEAIAAAAADATPAGLAAVAVSAPGAAGLEEPLGAAIAGALGRRGFAAAPLTAPERRDPDAAARARGADALVLVRLTLAGPSVAAAIEVAPARENFFLQARPRVRPGPGRVATLSLRTDAALLALAADRARPGALALTALADLPGRVLALAAGANEAGEVRLVAITKEEVVLLAPSGAALAAHPVPAPPPGPAVRDPAAVAAWIAGRIGYAVAGRSDAELLSAVGDRLERISGLPLAPLASGGAGALFGRFARGRGVLEDLLSATSDPEARPRSGRQLFGAAAAPRAGRAAFAVLDASFELQLLGAGLEPLGATLAGVGAAFALADLQGNGEADVVASSAEPGALDRVRVLRGRSAVFTSGPVEGALLAAAAADVTGDGLDDVVLAAASASGPTRLWLLSADARRSPP